MGRKGSKKHEGKARVNTVRLAQSLVSGIKSTATNIFGGVSRASWTGMLVSGVALLALMSMVTYNVTARFFFGKPYRGVLEVSEFLLVFVVFLGVAYTQAVKGHVRTEIVISHWAHRKREVLDAFYIIVGIIFFILIARQNIIMGFEDIEGGVVSDLLRVPRYPFKFAISFGSALMILQLLVDFSGVLRNLLRIR